MVQIIRKGALPHPAEVPLSLRAAAAAAHTIKLREPRPVGFPLLFDAQSNLIESAVAYLHEHGVQRAHSADTVRTYAEILHDWFDTLEQNEINWRAAAPADLIAYRNRMMTEPSGHTARPYSARTINHRVRGVLRFYEWAVRTRWLTTSPLVGRESDFSIPRHARFSRLRSASSADASFFVLRQYEAMPRPLGADQVRELLAALLPPYDLMARWQIYTGLRVSELLRLKSSDLKEPPHARDQPFKLIDVLRKGRKEGYVIASRSLLDETAGFVAIDREAWLRRRARRGLPTGKDALFIGSRGTDVSRNRYQQVLQRAGQACGFKVASHVLRATFACMMLERLEQLAKAGASINPLFIVKILMGHERIETTDRYLRAISIDSCVLTEVFDALEFG
jgi:site-specific recombinase XerD